MENDKTTEPSMEPIIREGYLSKKNPGGIHHLHTWKMRYFELSRSNLIYYLTHSKETELGRISVSSISAVNLHKDKKRGKRFDIETKGRIYSLESKNEESTALWVKDISEAIHNFMMIERSQREHSRMSTTLGKVMVDLQSSPRGPKDIGDLTTPAGRERLKSFNSLSSLQSMLLGLFETEYIDAFEKSAEMNCVTIIRGSDNDEDLLQYLLMMIQSRDNELMVPDTETGINYVLARSQILELINRVPELRKKILVLFDDASNESLLHALVISLYWEILMLTRKKEHVCNHPDTCSRCKIYIDEFVGMLIQNVTDNVSTMITDCLFSLLIDGFWNLGKISHTVEIRPKVAAPELWSSYFLVLSFSDAKVKHKILYDLTSLMSDANIPTIIRQKEWQNWFEQLFTFKDEKDEELLKCRSMILNILAHIMGFMMMNNDDFGDQVLSLMQLFMSKGQYEPISHELILLFLTTLVKKNAGNTTKMNASFNNLGWTNSALLLQIINNFLFKTSFLCSIYPKEKSTEGYAKFSDASSTSYGLYIDKNGSPVCLELAVGCKEWMQKMNISDYSNAQTKAGLDEAETAVVDNLVKIMDYYSDLEMYLLTVKGKGNALDPKELSTQSRIFHTSFQSGRKQARQALISTS